MHSGHILVFALAVILSSLNVSAKPPIIPVFRDAQTEGNNSCPSRVPEGRSWSLKGKPVFVGGFTAARSGQFKADRNILVQKPKGLPQGGTWNVREGDGNTSAEGAFWEKGESRKRFYRLSDIFFSSMISETSEILLPPDRHPQIRIGIPVGYYANMFLPRKYHIKKGTVNIKSVSSFFQVEVGLLGDNGIRIGVWPKRKYLSVDRNLPSRLVAKLWFTVVADGDGRGGGIPKDEDRTVNVDIYFFKNKDCKEGEWTQFVCANPDVRNYAFDPKWIPLASSYRLVDPPDYSTREIVRLYRELSFGSGENRKRVEDLKIGEGVIFNYRGILFDIVRTPGGLIGSPRY